MINIYLLPKGSKIKYALGALAIVVCTATSVVSAKAQLGRTFKRAHKPAAHASRPLRGYGYRPSKSKASQQVYSDPRAVNLLLQTFTSHAFYKGVQHTQVGSQISVQNVMGGPQGRLRLDYISPPRFAGDVMVTAPKTFLHYISTKQRTYVTHWPAGKRMRIATRLRTLIRNGKLLVTQTGWQEIAGVNCTIVRIARNVAGVPGGVTQRQVWIDPANGIILRNERWSPAGIQSVSYFTSIDMGGASGVTMRDFTVASLPANSHRQRIINQSTRVLSLEAAEQSAGIHVLLPAYIPAGYHINGIWTVHHGKLTSVLMRYSAGVNHFSIFEHQVLRRGSSYPHPPLRPRAGVQTWRQKADGTTIAITYIGSLAPSDQITMERSFR